MSASRGPIADVDIRLLRVFRAVVECGGFSAAEAELDVARSTISTHIATLEARLGLRLCERGRGGFSLTAPGELVYAETLRVLGALDEFRSRVGAAGQQLVGELNIGVIDNLLTLPEIGLPEAIGRFRAAAPRVHVGVRVLAADEIERGLAGGQIHVGFYAPHRFRADLSYREVAEETQRLYCGRAHPCYRREVSETDIESLAFVGRSYLDEAKARDRPWRVAPAATANNLEAILMLVLSGGYAGLLPVQYARPWLERGDLATVRPDIVSVRMAFSMVTVRTRSPAPVTRAFLEAYG